MYKTYQNKLSNRLCYNRKFLSYLYIFAYYCCLIIPIFFLCYVFIIVLYFLNLLQFLFTFCYTIYSVDFLPSSRSPEDIFVFFSKSVLVFLTVVGFFSLIFLTLGWQDGCVCSLLELSSSTSATEQHLNILKLYNISMPIVYCTNYSLILSKIFF